MAEINTIDKLEHRIMGEYSIAKSFKGILRIAHIKDVSSDATNTDEFLNPTFYGNPTDLMDISGKESSKQSAGYANAIKALQGGLSRYNCYTLDKLRLNRVPVTDSMGNYLNWNVGLDGVTIGSNEKINGYSPAKIKIENCTYQELFPVLKTNNLTVGLTKMLLGIDKGSVNDASVILEGATQTPMIVVQNFYDKSDANKSYDENLDEVIDIKIGEEIEGAKDIQIKSKFFKYNEEQLGGYKEYRTIYTNTKENVEDYDVFMYKQDNFDIIDVEDVKNFDIIDGENDKKHHYIHHSKVDVVNLKNYVKKMIDKFMKGNVVEVPTGAVIWQYCSLDKWRAEKESADGDSIDMGNNGYPGHRPPMQQRQYSLQHVNPFYNTTIQGACRKQTYLSGSSQIINNTSDSSESSDMTLTENNSLLDEIIPLYKRDYVLCDGSVFRIPYYPIGYSSNLSGLMEHRNRFFELFFNLGYKYTSKDKLLQRPKMKRADDGRYYLVKESDNNEMITDENLHKIDYIKDAITNTDGGTIFTKLSSGQKFNIWKGDSKPAFIPVTDSVYNNCDDLDVLFQEDLTTMLCCDEIYRFVRSMERSPDSNYRTPSQDEIIDHLKLKTTKLPESYIFNSYIGDTKNEVKTYSENSHSKNKVNEANKLNLDTFLINIHYYGCTSNDKPKLLLGREVSTFDSLMKFYDTEQQTYVNVRPYELPLVTYFMQLITSTKGIDLGLQPFLYTFFNYDFQVPHFLSKDKTPTFIGSGAYLYANPYVHLNNTVQTWSCNYDSSFMPHRHYIARSIYNTKDDSSNTYTYYGYNNNDNLSYYKNTSIVSEYNSVQAEVCNGQIFPCTGSKHGWEITQTDGSGSYILRDVPVKLEKQVRNGVPALIAKNGGFPKITTDYTVDENDEKFEFNDATSENGYQTYWEKHKNKWYTFTMGEDDPRFENIEPNRGMSSQKCYTETFQADDGKISLNRQNWIHSSVPSYFSMENITMLPLIKL